MNDNILHITISVEIQNKDEMEKPEVIAAAMAAMMLSSTVKSKEGHQKLEYVKSYLDFVGVKLLDLSVLNNEQKQVVVSLDETIRNDKGNEREIQKQKKEKREELKKTLVIDGNVIQFPGKNK